MNEEEQIIEERKRKLLEVFKKEWVLIGIFLIFLVALGMYIRYQPLAIHEGGKPGLWDITLNDYTLGPDLDPWLFTRYAKTIIEKGSLPEIDIMRNTPLGFNTRGELQMVSYMIVITYKVLNIFGTYSENFAAAFMPVWAFGLTIIAFFFFVREIFVKKKKENEQIELDVLENGTWLEKNNLNANLIALISTLFMITIPIFLSRTVAGIPEKESAGFLFMFLAFFLFLKAWKTKTFIKAGIFGVLAGFATALMGLTWGGVTYIYFTMGLASFIGFLLNKFNNKNKITFAIWLFSSLLIAIFFTNRISIKVFLTSLDTGLCLIILFIFVVDYLLWNTKFKLKILDNIKLPKNIISILIGILLAIILVSILDINTIPDKARVLYQTLVKPVTGRWSTTVAENRQPYFTEWSGSFGPIVFNIPLVFWMFFLGSVFLFKSMLNKIDKNHAWILTGLYVLFFFGLVFSRYASHPAFFDGEGIISLIFYFGSAIILAGSLIYFYIKYYQKEHKGFEEIEFPVIFLFSLFILCLFTARSAVRLIMVLGPIAPIFVAFAIIYIAEKFLKGKDETDKTFYGAIIIILIVASVFSVWAFYKETKTQAYYFIPGSYNQQWQKAMDWVRTNTPENAVFSHWWDYGYWVQSIGNRATMVDGGNAMVYWNYLIGRHILTGNNEKDALDLLYAHNVSYFLIDSSDIGKYGAFAQIGSDENYDRMSSGPVTLISPKNQRQEISNGLLLIYYMPGVANGRISLAPIEEDLTYEINGTKKTLLKEKTGFGGIKIKIINEKNKTKFEQPIAMFFSQNSQIEIPMRYIYDGTNFYDFGTGIEAAASIIPQLNQDSSGQVSLDSVGACIWVSPRVLRGFLGQMYILNDPFKKFTHFKIVYQQSSPVTEALRAQNINTGEWVYFNGLQGPITIWKVNYSGSEEIRQEFLDTDSTKYLSWQL